MSYLRMVNDSLRKRKKILNAKNTKDRSRGTTYSQCLKKKAYAGYRAAQRAVDKALQERSEELRIYECYNCDMYHLSKRKKS